MEKQRKYSLGTKLGYAAADVLGGGAFALMSLLFLNFLVKIEGMSPALAGVIVMIGKFWDAIIDPALGILTDKTRSRFGRRRVFLLIGIVPVIVTFSLLWYSFGLQSTSAKFAYYVVMYLMFSTSYSIVQVPYNALLTDMVDSYKDRAGFTTMRILISNLSATISVTVPSMLLGAEIHRTTGSYLTMSIIFALFFALPILITFFTTWENKSGEQEENITLKMLFGQLFAAFRNKTFRQYIGIFGFGQAATDVCTAITAFWLADILHRSGFLTVASGISMIVGLCTLPINNFIAKKYGKHCPSYIMLPFRVLGLAFAFFMGPATGTAFLILVCVLNGIGSGAAAFVPYTLMPDLPDSQEVLTGKRNAGIFAGLSTFVRTFTSGIAIFLTGVVLDMFGYAESTAGQTVEQTSTALFGVRFMFSIVPIVLTLVTIWLGLRYVFTQKHYAATRAAVEHKHQSGAPTTDPELVRACETTTGIPFAQTWAGRAAQKEVNAHDVHAAL